MEARERVANFVSAAVGVTAALLSVLQHPLSIFPVHLLSKAVRKETYDWSIARECFFLALVSL